jgi:guanylate kinase
MNKIIVITGPSGCGKTTLIRQLLQKYPNLCFSISHTTRQKRQTEQHGIDYYFVTKDQFQQMIENGELLEWALVHGNLYGTSYREIDEKSKNTNTLVLDVDINGAKNIRKLFSQALLIMVIPPNLAELKQRLTGREQRYDEEIKKRLSKAKEEISQYRLFDYIIVNDNLDRAFASLEIIYQAYLNSVFIQEPLIKTILRGAT